MGPHTVRAVDGVSMSIPRGKMVAITGPSGCGKTTLLYILGALEQPTSGKVLVDGVEVSTLSGSKAVEYRRTKVGFVFQNYYLVPNLSALENVMLPMDLRGVPRGQQEARAEELLTQVGIEEERLDHKPGKLSGGQQQRVVIARALANDPALILADEPTGNLDRRSGRQIVDLLLKLVETQGRTVVVVTHDPSVARKAHLRLRMADGKVLGPAGVQAAVSVTEEAEEEEDDMEVEEAPQEELTIDDLLRGRQ
ncbi:MAG: ABC transporter ATP-binding protein [Chloroflexi bacterium]|nr:ABC transporter ATP-binding protein [Chloroflexota bacterium]